MQIAQIKEDNSQKLLIAFVIFSIFLHFTLILIAYKYPVYPSNKGLSSEEPVDIKIVSPLDSQNILNRNEGKIVDLVDNLPSKTPKQTRFLSDRDRSVDKESQASITGRNPNAPFTMLPDNSENRFEEKSSQRKDEKPGLSKGQRKDSNRDKELNLFPSHEQLSRYFTVAPNNYLPGVEMGNATLLNTWGFAYSGFYVRIKRQMEAIWDPRASIDKYRPLSKDLLVTALNIVLNSDGSLYSVRLEKSSGYKELDEEAFRTVRESAPFLNPPKGLAAPDGKIYIPKWNFIITFRGGF